MPCIPLLDRFPVPSLEAAGNDINKVVRTEYPGPLYTKLATDAKNIWSDPNGLLAGLYHPSGGIIGASDRSMPFIQASIQSAKVVGTETPTLVSTEQVHQTWPMLNGDLPGWQPYWSSGGAWVNAREGITRMARKAMNSGVKYISGDAGYVKQLLFDADSTCIGVRCADGSTYYGKKIVVAAGAAAGSPLDLKGQIVAKGHTVGHIQLSPEEVKKYKDIPIIDHLEGGILFPPQEDGIMKIGAIHFVTNYAKSYRGMSLPRYRSDNPGDGVPAEIEARLRRWMSEFVPELAQREWIETRICWDGDMADYHFLITPHPTHTNLSLAIGGSAHGFKFLPVLGQYIIEMMEGTLDPAIANKWKWRPGAKLSACEANPHPEVPVDLSTLRGWEAPPKSLL
ncbi:sarcosine oxidase, putative [Talaromyces marneffei ATCC 18224]|uniref:Sarcosine oxidase, putative n=1 Tax=Talaromyces marneffei (strain ATCC 18224 / CBS 334.59 / QM 7333) TaxID=441960 RepID=B6QBG3_TALMQ|nr:sarcosine oxidase, putative [Talaromyces marneffei ATCC 18224]